MNKIYKNNNIKYENSKN